MQKRIRWCLGFHWLIEGAPGFPVRPEDDMDAEISADEGLEVAGREIPEGQVVVRPTPEDE